MIDELKKRVLMSWESFARDIPVPKAGELLAVKTGDSTRENLRLYFFTGKGSAPVCMAKLARNPDDAPVLRREFDVLGKLTERFSGRPCLLRSIPRPVALLRVENETALLLLIAPGPPFERLLAAESLFPFLPKKVPIRIARLREWLQAFQQCTKGAPVSENMRARKIAISPIPAAWNGQSDRIVERLHSAVEELGTLRYAPVARQGNLSPRSAIACREGEHQILDWECFQESGHPLDDPLDLAFSTFATLWSRQAGKDADGFWDAKSPIQNELWGLIAQFGRSAGLSPDQTYLYMLLHAAEWQEQRQNGRIDKVKDAHARFLQALVSDEKKVVDRLERPARN